MEWTDYLDETKLKIEAKKGLSDNLVVRFGVRNHGIIQIVDLSIENVLEVINELNSIVEDENN